MIANRVEKLGMALSDIISTAKEINTIMQKYDDVPLMEKINSLVLEATSLTGEVVKLRKDLQESAEKLSLSHELKHDYSDGYYRRDRLQRSMLSLGARPLTDSDVCARCGCSPAGRCPEKELHGDQFEWCQMTPTGICSFCILAEGVKE